MIVFFFFIYIDFRTDIILSIKHTKTDVKMKPSDLHKCFVLSF